MKTSFQLPLLLTLFAVLGVSQYAQATIPLTPNRAGHEETRLLTGKVLITGGENETAWLNSALLYDPTTGTFTAVGNMTTPRAFHTATLLQDGTVLITGGEQGSGLPLLKTAELFNPRTNQFTSTIGHMSIARENHTATLLLSGKVLIVGGKQADLYDPIAQTFSSQGTPPNGCVTCCPAPPNRSSHATALLQDGTALVTGGYVGSLPAADAWVYNPTANCFTEVGMMSVPRANQAMTLMLDGTVLVTGGFSGTSPHDDVDIYNPISQNFTATQHMIYHRSNHRALLLADGTGRVQVIGGTTLESGFLAQNEIYDPNNTVNHWTQNNTMAENRSGMTATLLSNGSILVTGGLTGNLSLQTAETLDPVTHNFTSTPCNMTIARNQHTGTLLASGKVLLAAGSDNNVFLNTAELFDPTSNCFTPTGSLQVGRDSHTATLLQDNNSVLIAGGKSATGDLASAEMYNSSTGVFANPSPSPMIGARSLHTATLLNNGTVLVAGGRKGPNPLNTAEIFNPATNSFFSTGMLHVQRKRHAANLLLDGTVLVEGGASVSNGQPVNQGTPTAEVYTITGLTSGTWANHPPGDMSTGRTEHTATLLPSGAVLVCGGVSAVLPSDLYNWPNPSQTFSTTGGLLHQRQRHVSLLLTNPAWGSLVGKVLAIGGAYTGSPVFGGIQVALATVEMYDPSTGQFTLFGSMTQPRQNHTATMLNDGRILIAGGVSSPSVSGTAELVTP